MYLRRSGKQGFVSLLVVASLVLAAGGAWAAHNCCGHPSGSHEAAAGSGTNESPSDGDCVCTCCQSETAISPLPGISFRSVSWWSLGDVAAFAVSRFETDIFRPPLA
jgi:hypothetical protein